MKSTRRKISERTPSFVPNVFAGLHVFVILKGLEAGIVQFFGGFRRDSRIGFWKSAWSMRREDRIIAGPELIDILDAKDEDSRRLCLTDIAELFNRMQIYEAFIRRDCIGVPRANEKLKRMFSWLALIVLCGVEWPLCLSCWFEKKGKRYFYNNAWWRMAVMMGANMVLTLQISYSLRVNSARRQEEVKWVNRQLSVVKEACAILTSIDKKKIYFDY